MLTRNNLHDVGVGQTAEVVHIKGTNDPVRSGGSFAIYKILPVIGLVKKDESVDGFWVQMDGYKWRWQSKC